MLVAVPSRLVATVVKWTMSRLLPDMSSTFIIFQVVLPAFESALHANVQFVPSLNESFGPGAVGVGSAKTKREAAKMADKVKTSILLCWKVPKETNKVRSRE